MLTKDWNEYSAVKQRWLVYRALLDLGGPATQEMIEARFAEKRGIHLKKNTLKIILRCLLDQQYVRTYRSNNIILWDVSSKRGTYSISFNAPRLDNQSPPVD